MATKKSNPYSPKSHFFCIRKLEEIKNRTIAKSLRIRIASLILEDGANRTSKDGKYIRVTLIEKNMLEDVVEKLDKLDTLDRVRRG